MHDEPDHARKKHADSHADTSHPALSHLETLRTDVREELKQRIDQRDRYSVQLTLSLGAIVAFSFSKDGFRMALVAAPLVSIYFTVLILYSYQVHRVLAEYLRDEIEPAVAKAAGTDANIELETWYKSRAVPGIRKSFFLGTLWFVTALIMLYLLAAQRADHFDEVVLWWLSAVYFVAVLLITIYFGVATPSGSGPRRS